ncbi:MAG: PKD domain-containing protein [Luteitalea sp.]|nr:PKD domain-containing protein [Luteitalea sp.]
MTRTIGTRRRLACLLVVIVSAASLAELAQAQVRVPDGFDERLAVDVGLPPTALAFTPDGRMLIATQSGRLLVKVGDELLPTPAVDLSSRICSNVERGLLGVAVDPAFAENHYIYLYYTFNKHGTCETNSRLVPVNRVSRVVLGDDNLVDAETELILLDNIPSTGGNHNAGDLRFGPDGYLYVAVGDGGCDYLFDSGCAGANNAARDPHVLLGKILRITRDGGIPPTNPFQGPGTAPCRLTGRAEAGLACRETFASGLRNPFRFAFDTDAATPRLLINDVGQNQWEEINLGVPGADYGWNEREGPCVAGSRDDCGQPPQGLTNPLHAYSHSTGCGSITGGAFVPAESAWPAEYVGTYLFADFNCGKIFALGPGAGGDYQSTTFADGFGTSSIVTMTFGPVGGRLGLYYATYRGGGEVRVITFEDSGNRAPTAAATATPRSGGTPLTVLLDATGSSDPDGDRLSFAWDFGDGTPTQYGPRLIHTYTSARTYTAEVTVRDASHESRASVRIDVGNRPPAPTILSPAPGFRFSVGQTVVLNGRAWDREDGTFVPNLRWRVILHHGSHTHPFLPPTIGNGIEIVAPPPEDFPGATNSYLEIELTAVDSQGLAATVTQKLFPRWVGVTVTSVPAGLELYVNETPVQAPFTFIGWPGWQMRVIAPSQPAPGNADVWLVLDEWSDGGEADHLFVVPDAPTRLTARYRATGNLAVGHPAVASSASSAPPAMAVDGSDRTAWIGEAASPQWLFVDLGTPLSVERIRLKWGTQHAAAYSFWTSQDGVDWALLRRVGSDDGGIDDAVGFSARARFVGLFVEESAPGRGVALRELEVFGQLPP